ncbi:xylose isomerase [Paenibacillus mucilaginosus]|nr:TIM barrel protein [Paenibacillus mucilaginosus]WFA17714.1 xylose isomerase [Paenibacillus mucilaginosus]
MEPKITMLNSMGGGDFTAAMDQFVRWGLDVVDLKDGIYGKSIGDLTEEETDTAAQALQERNLSVYCFSTGLFYEDIEYGEQHFRDRHLGMLDNILRSAQKLRPLMIRLLAAQTAQRDHIVNSTDYIRECAPWVFEVYREAIDRIHDAGFQVTIENEAHACIWASPQEVVSFYQELDRSGRVHFTWDVQNLWQMGTFPSLSVYNELRPLIGFLHLKGGQVRGASSELVWKSALEDASWPVEQITRQAIADGVSPVICLNPSHGQPKEGYDYNNLTERDLLYLRSIIWKEVSS